MNLLYSYTAGEVNDQLGQQCKFLGVHTALYGVVEH